MANLRLVSFNRLEQTINTSGAGLLNGPSVNYADGLGTATNTSITRKSGAPDFTTAGVKRWSLLAGTIAARFPGGTRVTNVTASTLTMSNASSSTVSNNPGEQGSFNPQQGLIQTTDGPMSNLFDSNLHTVWDPGVDAGGFGYPIVILFEWDFVSAVSGAVFGVIAPRTHNRALGSCDQVEFESATAYAGPYTLRATVVPSDVLRDNHMLTIASQVSARFWRAKVTFSNRADIAGLWMSATADTKDLGGMPVRSSVERMTPGAVIRNPAGRAFYSRTGIDRRVWRFPWSAMTTANRQLVEGVFENLSLDDTRRRQPMLIDDADRFWPVEFAEQRMGWSTLFTGVESQDLVLEEMT